MKKTKATIGRILPIKLNISSLLLPSWTKIFTSLSKWLRTISVLSLVAFKTELCWVKINDEEKKELAKQMEYEDMIEGM